MDFSFLFWFCSSWYRCFFPNANKRQGFCVHPDLWPPSHSDSDSTSGAQLQLDCKCLKLIITKLTANAQRKDCLTLISANCSKTQVLMLSCLTIPPPCMFGRKKITHYFFRFFCSFLKGFILSTPNVKWQATFNTADWQRCPRKWMTPDTGDNDHIWLKNHSTDVGKGIYCIWYTGVHTVLHTRGPWSH